jgi:hypothetical protein
MNGGSTRKYVLAVPVVASSRCAHKSRYPTVGSMSPCPRKRTSCRTAAKRHDVPEGDVTRGVQPSVGLLIRARTLFGATLGDEFGPTRQNR